MLGAVAELTVIDGKQAEFEVVAKELEAAVAANEPDVLYYKLFKVAEAPTTYIFMEQYRDQAAVDAHRGFEHFKRLGKAMGPLLAAPPKITRMAKV
ncbi:MAG: antibiotic biosynthesis monooxygenase [Hyphomonadaceae bacterium]|nr:antibiotic biosynthesis monooxygenase [Hyphomonadaceae bacterium]MBP9235141.1 antibiotic biosynthesis monooxygenase [Hyphomonadaceae bacterium]